MVYRLWVDILVFITTRVTIFIFETTIHAAELKGAHSNKQIKNCEMVITFIFREMSSAKERKINTRYTHSKLLLHKSPYITQVSAFAHLISQPELLYKKLRRHFMPFVCMWLPCGWESCTCGIKFNALCARDTENKKAISKSVSCTTIVGIASIWSLSFQEPAHTHAVTLGKVDLLMSFTRKNNKEKKVCFDVKLREGGMRQ